VASWDGRNRRGFQRYEVQVEARLAIGGVTLTGTLVDLGRGGALFATNVLVPEGTFGELRLSSRDVGQLVVVSRRHAPDGGEPGLGLRFLTRPPFRIPTGDPALPDGHVADGTPPEGVGSLVDDDWEITEPGLLPPDEDRRRLPRHHVYLEAQLAVGELRVPGVIRDVSNDGIFFETRALLSPGDEVRLVHPHLRLPDRLRVVRLGRSKSGRPGIGLKVLPDPAMADAWPKIPS
jgi:hypothetical protein